MVPSPPAHPAQRRGARNPWGPISQARYLFFSLTRHARARRITKVYGGQRTLKLHKQEVRHMLTGSRYKIYDKDKGKSVPKDVVPHELRQGACAIDRHLSKYPEHAKKKRTQNSAGGCPSSRVCQPADGKATGAALNQTWELVWLSTSCPRSLCTRS